MSPDGTRLVATTNKVYLQGTLGIAFNPDGKSYATADGLNLGATITCLDPPQVRTFKKQGPIKSTLWATAVRFSPMEKRLRSA